MIKGTIFEGAQHDFATATQTANHPAAASAETTKFVFLELQKGSHDHQFTTTSNLLIFIIDGAAIVSYDSHRNRQTHGGDMLLIPQSSAVTITITENTKLLYMSFKTPLGDAVTQHIKKIWALKMESQYDFAPLKQSYPITVFINSLVHLLQNGQAQNAELHDIKHREIMIILASFYSHQQFFQLFQPIIGESLDFRYFVLQNYENCKRVEELIDRYGEGANIFMRKFKIEFGTSAYQWMLKQKCRKIANIAATPGATIKAIMSEVGIENPTHFNRFCKRHFNLTPKQFIASNQ